MSEEKEAIGDDLNDKQARFCEEYLFDLNITQAAIRAGYSQHTAAQHGSRLLNDVKIQTRIQKLKSERSNRVQVDQDWVLKRFLDISDKCSQAEPSMVFDPVNKCMVQETTEDGTPLFKFDSSGANKATEMIAKHVGFFEKNNEQKKPIIAPQINMLPPSK